MKSPTIMAKKKLLLILNDVYQIFCFAFAKALLKIGNQAAQQVTNLPIFLSFLVMSVGILQISLDTRNSSIFKNYPLFSEKKNLQKFETLYFQSLDLDESELVLKSLDEREEVRIQQYEQLPEKQKRFFDYYQYLDECAQEYECPTIFNRIADLNKRQEAKNIYKNFEQIGPILFSELEKEKEEKKKTQKDKQKEQQTSIHLSVDIPYYHWYAPHNNFDQEKEKQLISWKFDDEDLIIRDLKKENYLDKSYQIIKKIFPQYKQYIRDENESKKEQVYLFSDIGFKNKYGRSLNKVFIETKFEPRKHSIFSILSEIFECFLNPLIEEEEKQIEKVQIILPNNIKISQIHFVGKSFLDVLYSRNGEKPKKRTHTDKNAKISPRVRSFLKHTKLVTGYEASIGKRPHFYKQKRNSEYRKRTQVRQILKILKKAAKVRGPELQISEDGVFLRSDWHQKHFDEFESKLPPIHKIFFPQTDEELYEISLDYFYQLQKIEDQIPLKIQGFKNEALPISGKKLTNLSFSANKYKEQQFKLISYSKSRLNDTLKKLSALAVEAPKNPLLFRKKYPKKKSLLGIEYLQSISNSKIRNRKGLVNFLDLLLTEMNIDKIINRYGSTLKKIHQLSFKRIKYFGYFNMLLLKDSYRIEPKMVKIEKIDKEDILSPSLFVYRSDIPREIILDPYEAHKKFLWEQKTILKWKPPFYYLDEYDFFIKYYDQYICLDLTEDLAFLDWCHKKEKEKKTLDHYFEKSSHLLELKEKNSYFTELTNTEDYLLEAILTSFKKNKETLELKIQDLKNQSNQQNIDIEEEEETTSESENEMDENKDFDQNTETEEEIELEIEKNSEFEFLKSLFTLFPEEVQNEKYLCVDKKKYFYPSEVTSFILNFLNHRKNQRNLFFKKNSVLLQRKDVFEKQKKMQIASLHQILFYNNFFENFSNNYFYNILENILQNSQIDIFPYKPKNLKYNYIYGPNNKIVDHFFPSKIVLIFKHLNKNTFSPFKYIRSKIEILLNKLWSYSFEKFLTEQQEFLTFLTFDWEDWVETQRQAATTPTLPPVVPVGAQRAYPTRGQTGTGTALPDLPALWATKDGRSAVAQLNKKTFFEKIQLFSFNLQKKIFFNHLKTGYILSFKDNTFFSIQKNLNIYLKLLETDLKFHSLWIQKHFFQKESVEKIEKNFNSHLQNFFWEKRRNRNKGNMDLVGLLNTENDPFFTYFWQKLPRIPRSMDWPLLVVNLDNKKGYPYRIENLPVITERKMKIFEQFHEILSILRTNEFNFNDILNLDLENFDYFYDFFYYKVGDQFLEDFYDIEENIFQNESFEETVDHILNILKNEKNYFCKQEIHPPIYQTFVLRKMSGYFCPDLARIQNIHQTQITEIPILNFNNIDFITDEGFDFQVLPQRTDQYKIFKKIGLSVDRQFFEFRESLNEYSWSILFFFSSGWVFVNIFKNVYKKYAKEIVESCIDFLKRAGILDDVQWIKEELGMTPVDKGYRGIRNHGKKFKNIIGLDRKHIILQVSEMVWFLKTKKLLKSNTDPLVFLFLSKSTTTIKFLKNKLNITKAPNYLKPKGFLFTGPPGTGKTLLVQAIAGETGVPVVTQSGGLLQNPRLRGKGAKTLHKLFVRAREIAPCIIFIDELDGIGARRQFLPIYIDIHGRYDPIAFLESYEAAFPPKIFQAKIQRRFEFFNDQDPYWEEPEFTQTVQSTRLPIDVLQEMESSRGARNEQLSILTQLLIELDGLHPLDNILVIGATNRLEILDPALMRPGRFQRILKFNLPDYTARIDLLKLYTRSSKIGIEKISWDYFSKRTHGLSSADIASIVFASELTAVQESTQHTFETLERGIDLITSFPSDPVMFRLKNIFLYLQTLTQKFFSKNSFYFLNSSFPNLTFDSNKLALNETANILRNCYYHIGKMLIVFYLQPSQLFDLQPYISLWERPKNFRFFFFTKNFNEFSEFEQKRISRNEIEKRLLTFFGGKAAESIFIFLPLHKFSTEIYFKFHPLFITLQNSLEQSNFGIETEIQTAQSLLKLMIEKWYFYSEKIATEKFHPIFESSNLAEYSEKEKEIFLAQVLVDEMIIDLDMRNKLSKNEQKHSYQAWWMKKVATRLNYRENSYHLLQWSRIYLSDPENSVQNIEWVAPDEYFHTLLRTPPYCMAWSHFLENGRFTIENLLLLQSFNTVFKIFRQFSEFLDFLSDYLLRYECLREREFQSKIYQFFSLFKGKIF
uniref:Cell division protein FTSH n=1 Tax=Udotea flabellum TaxID=170437 RepID=A0A386B1P1_9CHLO|nr:Cell division protein FTSH [Udotea flabellum]AYC65624.1 Cell division protein FTSH [Udotea flabellum]